MSELDDLENFIEWDIGLVKEALWDLKKKRVILDAEIKRREQQLERLEGMKKLHKEKMKSEAGS